MNAQDCLLRAPVSLDPDEGWSWWLGGEIGNGSLAGFAAVLAGCAPAPRVLLLLPVSLTLGAPVTAPLRQQRQLLAALPFLLEETLAGDVESLHVVPGRRIDATRLQVLAIERETLVRLLALLAAEGIDPDAVLTDALPLCGDCLTVFLDGQRSLLATQDGLMLEFAAEDAEVVLTGIPLAAGDRVRLYAATAAAQAQAQAVATGLAATNGELELEIAGEVRPLLAWLATDHFTDPGRCIQFRQGIYAKAGQGEFRLGFDWRPLAWLAASLAVLALGHQVAVGLTHTRAAEATVQAQVDLYRQIFPGSTQVPSPREQMAGMMAGSGRVAGGFLPLVAESSGAIGEAGGIEAGFQPKSLAFDGSQGVLRLDIQARNVEDIDRLRQLMETHGLRVEMGAGMSQDGGYRARLSVSREGG